MKSFNRYSEKQAVTNDLYYESYDDDCLVDYDETDIITEKKAFKLSPAMLGKQVKRKLSSKKDKKQDYIIEYTCEGYIKRPSYSLAGGYDDHVAVSMDIIQSIILIQHCKIEQEKVAWFEDGIRWLVYKQSSSKRNEMEEMLELERMCEAYFGIPLGLCENHWASAYLVSQCRKKSSFHRKLLKPHIKKNGYSLRRFLRKLCCFPISMTKAKTYTSDYGAVNYNEKNYPVVFWYVFE